MKRTKCLLAASVLIVVLSVPVVPRTELLKEDPPWLIARPHPELGSIDSLKVVIVPSAVEAGKDDSLWRSLQTKVEQKLRQAGLKILDPTYLGRQVIASSTPQLNIYTDILKLEDAQRNILSIRAALARPVYIALPDTAARQFTPGQILKTEVWTTALPMKTVSAEKTPAQILEAALQLTDAFIAAWTAANPPDRQTAGAETVTPVTGESAAAPAQSRPAEYKYVASKNSKVFHMFGCSSAKRISAKNLVGYKTRTEAINTGRRPCKLCKP